MTTSNGDPPKRVLGTGYVTAPAECFEAEPATGVYLDTPGTASAYTITKRGHKRLRIDDTKTTITGPLYADGLIPSGSLSLPDGSASAPSLSFTSSPQTGLYKGASSGVSICTSSVPVCDFSTNYIHSLKPIQLPSGLLSSPALQFNNSTNSGLHLTSAPTLSVDTVVGGTLATSTTGAQFLGLNGGASTPGFSFVSDTGSGLYTPSVGTLAVSAGGTEVLECTSTSVDCKATQFKSPQLLLKNDGAANNLQMAFSNNNGIFNDVSGFNIAYNGSSDIVFGTGIQAYVPFSTGTNSLTCGSLTSGSMTCGTNSLTCGSLTSGSMTCGTNSLTCGALSSAAINSGTSSIMCGSLTVSGPINAGTNVITCGSLLDTLYNIRVTLTNPFAVLLGTHTDIIWDTLDSSTNWVTTIPGTPTATFTIPASGMYLAAYTIECGAATGTKFFYLWINGGPRRWADTTTIETSTFGKSGSMIYPFTAGDTITVRIFSAAAISVLGTSPTIMSQFSLNRLSA